MKINGIGIVSKKEAIKALGLDRDKEGREALRNGEFTDEEIAGMYKLQKVREACKIGSCGDNVPGQLWPDPGQFKRKADAGRTGRANRIIL